MLSEAGNSKANSFCSHQTHCDVQSQYEYSIQIQRTEDTATIPAPAHPEILFMLKNPNVNVE